MSLFINRRYFDITPESVQRDEHAAVDMLATCERVTFNELVSILKDHVDASCGCNRWNGETTFSSFFESLPVFDGVRKRRVEISLAASSRGDHADVRSWIKAAKQAGASCFC